MTTNRTIELENVNKIIREILEAHNCTIMATKDLKCVVIADNDNKDTDYIFSSGLVKKIN